MARKKSEKPGYFIISLSCGYCEDGKTSQIILASYGGFESPGNAVTELALDFYAKFCDDVVTRPCACPVDRWKGVNINYCPTCGCSMRETKFDPKKFTMYIRELQDSTADSYGDHEFANGRQLVFAPWRLRTLVGIKEGDIIDLKDHSEEIVLCALLEKIPGLMDEEMKEEREEYLKHPDEYSRWRLWDEVKKTGTTR